MVTLTQQGDTQCPRCLIKHPGYGYGNFCSRDCYNRYDGRSLCPQCRRLITFAGDCEVCSYRDSANEEVRRKVEEITEAVEPKRKPCVEDRCNYPSEPGWPRCTLHSGNQGKRFTIKRDQDRCIAEGCNFIRKPGFIACSIHIEDWIEAANNKPAQRDRPKPGYCGGCGKTLIGGISVFCSSECRANFYEANATTSSTNAVRTTKKGPVMTTQTYAKDVLLGYAQDKIEKFEEVIEDHADSDVAVLRQLVKDVEDDKVEKSNLVDKLAHRQSQSRYELHAKHDGVDVSVARRELKLLNRLVRRLEAIDGDSLDLTDDELNEMGIV